MIGDRCEWCVRRGSKLLQCTAKSRQTVYLDSQPLDLCSNHAAEVSRLLARKARQERSHAQVMQEIAREQDRIVQAFQERTQRMT